MSPSFQLPYTFSPLAEIPGRGVGLVESQTPKNLSQGGAERAKGF